MPAATEEALVETLSQQDLVAPKFQVHPVPSKEEYLYIGCSGGTGTMKALHHAVCGQAQRHTKRQGIWVLGSQVVTGAAGTGLRRRIRAAVTEWATVIIHLTWMQDIA